MESEIDKNLDLERIKPLGMNLKADVDKCVIFDAFPEKTRFQSLGGYIEELTDNCYLIELDDYLEDPSRYGRASHPFKMKNKREKEYYYFVNPTKVTINGKSHILEPEEDLQSVRKKGQETCYERVFPRKFLYFDDY